MKFMRKLVASVAAVTVAATSVATFAFSASALTYENDAIVSTDKGPYTAYLCIQAGADKRSVTDDYPNAVEKEKNSKGISCADATFTGNGTYTVSVTVANGSDTIEQLMLETDINSYAFAPKEAETVKGTLPTGCTVSIVINSITVKQTSGSGYSIPYNGASKGALCQGDNDSSIRVNILNAQTTPKVSDISNDLSGLGGLAGGDTVEVSFTVSGLDAGGNGGEETTTTTTTTTDENGGGGETTTTAAGSTTTTTANGESDSSGSSGSSSGSSSGNRSGNKSGNNSTASQTGDFGIAAVVIGSVAAAALGAGAYTVTRRKK
ncbi:hypothetical protein [uncultured Ruminococcus sp.]|uniref:hypothetical protein n=1 Tax=uncultured Ruminococcus sp. TaxID=165186 RepID=UPI0026775B4A|nr:hypothetical protein [uncultured Ruminococcus sp.]